MFIRRYVQKYKRAGGGIGLQYEPKDNSRQVIDTRMEKELVDYLATCSTMNYGLAFSDCCKFSFELAVASSVKVPSN